MKTLKNALALFWTGLSLTACAGDHIRWTEEVKLSDGKIIQLQRHVELTDSGFPAQSRGFDKYQEICYPPMGIHWKSKRGYQPDIFDIVDGRAYMHVPIYSCIQCMSHGYPETDALYYVWDNNTWRRINHDEFPIASEWNLLMQTSRGGATSDPKGLITISDKTAGTWNDSSLRFEQKRRGWKRVSEAGKGVGRCNSCRSVKATTDETAEIFSISAKNDCQPSY